MIKDNLLYKGIVKFNFYDKNNNLKYSYSCHNLGTPYFFSVIEDILKNGINKNSDNRPGKIMLTNPGFIKVTNATLTDPIEVTLNSGRYSSENGYEENNDSNLVQLVYPLPKISIYTSLKDTSAFASTNSLIPILRLEFNISYYDLISTIGDITNLDRYRFWLLSISEDSFKNILDFPLKDNFNYDDSSISNDSSSESYQNYYMSKLLNNISYESVNNNKTSKICAEVLLKKENDDINYSLNEGEYITVLWDIQFLNLREA